MGLLFTPPEGLNTFMVGGAVRDIIGEFSDNPKDYDFVVVGATPEQLLNKGFRQVGADFPVFLHPDTGFEYALARTEKKVSPGYHGFDVRFSPDVTLEEDLGRRDLTINAMAMSPDFEIFDPFGGLLDIKLRVLRHVDASAFKEDPVRILRLARFAARFRDFTVAPETMALCKEMVVNGEVDHLKPERVWKEISRGLMEEKPSRMFEVLQACGALARIGPELSALWGVPQSAEHHPEVDTGVHVMMALDMAAHLNASDLVRYMVLVHDLGKGVTPEALWPKHHNHEEMGVPLVKALSERWGVPTVFKEMGMLASEFHLHIHRALESRPGTLVGLFQSMDAFRRPERIQALVLASVCDARGRLGFEDRDYPQAPWVLKAFESARAVNAKAIAEKAKTPSEIPAMLYSARSQAVAALKSQQA